MPDTLEPHVPAPKSSESTSNVSAQIFSNPDDFLNTLKSNFAEISQGKEGVDLPGLLYEEKHGSTEKVRAAASIAAEHLPELANLYQEVIGEGHPPKGMTLSDIDFAIAMNDHHTLGYAATDVAEGGFLAATGAVSAAAMIGGGGFLASSAFAEASEDVIGAAVFGSAGVAIAVAGGAISLGLAGYAIYGTAKEIVRLNQLSDTESTKFNSWIKPQG